MQRFLYNIGIYIYGAGIKAFSIANNKARKWIYGRFEQHKKLEKFSQNKDKNSLVIWVHCASLGEFEQGRPVIEAFREKLPDTKIVLSFFSPSGYEIRQHYAVADLVCYLPLDTKTEAQNFIKLIQPTIAIFVKYEFWANYLYELERNKIPVFLIAANFRSNQIFFKSYGTFFANLIKKFQHIFVQNNKTVELLKQIGYSNCSVAGDTRVDRVIAIAGESKTFPTVDAFVENATKIVMCGSTWQEDETYLLRYIHQHKNKEGENVKFIIAPHEVKSNHINQLAVNIKVNYQLFSTANMATLAQAHVLIIDNIGMLAHLYRYGNIAYIGGGFHAGIHNILEPAAFGLPIVFGKRFQKFPEAIQLLAEGGAFSIENDLQLQNVLDELLYDAATHKKASTACKNFIENNCGATDKIINELLPILQ
ncbi:MAG: 3-deoxy-D-manno-octulosonic acid transferase [Saprospiraceae bacterium]|nr:3-deoxy-D-manno-octulosonic acid transferase [Saprospiraceae bacterium]MBP7699277.1 3-deoxy-D-manno-octulosonic acid transferase [Saprospiraceae bacterium]